MGAWDDAADQFELMQDEIESRIREAMDNQAWLTNNGREIPISEMGDRHLLNSYRMLVRAGEDHSHYEFLPLLKAEMSRRHLKEG